MGIVWERLGFRGHDRAYALVDRGGQVPRCRTFTSSGVVPPAHEVDDVAGGDDPPEVPVPVSVTGRRGTRIPSSVATALIMLCVGGTEITSRVAIAITSPSCLDNMGLELDRAPIEFSLHFEEPVPCLWPGPFWFVNVPLVFAFV